MAAMTSAQIAQELQRKRNANILPSDPKNLKAYNALTPQKTAGVAGAAVGTQKVNEGSSGVRSFFEGNGYDVGWNPANKMVTVNGKDAISPSQNIGGTTYASQGDLDSTLSRIQGMETNKKTNDILSQIEERMKTPYTAPQFNYDPTTDPAYQSALSRAQANASTASGNAMAELNRRGILNSTITSDRTAQIQQGEMGRVSSEILPQLMSQAYQRHRDSVGDQFTQNRNSISDLGSLLGLNVDLNQNRLDNTNAERDYNRGVLEYDDTTAYNRERDATTDSQWTKEFNEMIKQNGISNAINWAQENRVASNSGGSGSSGGSNPASITQLLAIWKASGQAPEGIPGVAPGTKLYDEVAARKAAEEKGGSGTWNAIKGILGSVVSGVSKLAASTVSDDEISQYLK